MIERESAVVGGRAARRGGDVPPTADGLSYSPALKNYQTLLGGLAVMFVVFSILMIVSAWIVPQIGLRGSVVFTLIAIPLLIAGALQYYYRVALLETFCGACPPAPFPIPDAPM
jgi:hypothetical protein